MRRKLGILAAFLFIVGCGKEKKEEPIVVTPEELHKSVDKVVDIIIHDIFSPPVASRIFAYPNIAAYEIMALDNDNYLSLAGQINDFKGISKPETDKPINYQVASLVVHMELSKRLIFSEKNLEIYRDSLYGLWNGKNPSVFEASKEYGLKVADEFAEWMKKDNYAQTRTMPKFTVDTDDPARWQPTPPAYMDGVEPHWNKIRSLTLDSAAQFKPDPPYPFSLEKDSDFYIDLKEVYDVGKKIEALGDTSEEIKIAQFWDCNPYVSVTKGHLMFATKKISPGAHWLGITKIAAKNSKYDFNQTLYAYTKASLAIMDGFISCWDEKYRSNLIRPETLINQHIDENWTPVLQTPPFPEYTSGHSVVSGAASVVLTSIFGDNFPFDDDTEVPYGLPVRSFTSFNQAADEAAISRLYGGIHYRKAIEDGILQGRNLGNFIVNKIKMIKNTDTDVQ